MQLTRWETAEEASELPAPRRNSERVRESKDENAVMRTRWKLDRVRETEIRTHEDRLEPLGSPEYDSIGGTANPELMHAEHLVPQPLEDIRERTRKVLVEEYAHTTRSDRDMTFLLEPSKRVADCRGDLTAREAVLPSDVHRRHAPRDLGEDGFYGDTCTFHDRFPEPNAWVNNDERSDGLHTPPPYRAERHLTTGVRGGSMGC